MIAPAPGFCVNIQLKNNRINGKRAQSNKTMLNPKSTPFNKQH